MNKEIMKILLPEMKKAMDDLPRVSYEAAVLENIRDLLECLILQTSMMMTDEQFKNFQDHIDELKTL